MPTKSCKKRTMKKNVLLLFLVFTAASTCGQTAHYNVSDVADKDQYNALTGVYGSPEILPSKSKKEEQPLRRKFTINNSARLEFKNEM
jgi:TctA family transporter